MAVFSRLSLRSTMLAVIVLAIVPTLGLTLLHGIEHMHDSKRQAQVQALGLAADIAHEQSELTVSSRRILQTLAMTPAIQQHDAAQSTRLLQPLLKEYGEPYLNFLAIDVNGQAFAQSMQGKLNNYMDRQWFRDVLQTGKAVTSGFIIGKAIKRPIMAMSWPARDADDNIHAVLAVGIGLASLEHRLGSSLVPKGSIIGICDHEGTILAREPSRPELIGTNKKDFPLIRSMMTTREGVLEEATLDGVERIVAFTRMFPDIDKSPIIYVGVDRAVAYAEAWSGLYRQFLWLTVLLCAGLAVAAFFGGRFLVQPAAEIADAADKIGQGKLSRRICEQQLVREYGQIASAFNAMAGQLEARALKLEEQAATLVQNNAELTDQIASRMRAEQNLARHAEKLQRSNEELEQFAYVASHDLQEPLRIIYSYLQLIERRYQPIIDDDGKRFIQATKDASERMRALIHGLLDYSRLSTRAQPFEEVDITSVMSEARQLLSESIAECAAVLTEDPLPVVPADRRQMLQLFQNLISNAIKYRKPDQTPHVHVSGQAEDDHWHFTIRDDGIGIEAEYHERIFGMFQRLHSRAHYQGTGIGLTLCRKIVERHNGRIWVESKAGQGSTFHFTLAATEVQS